MNLLWTQTPIIDGQKMSAIRGAKISADPCRQQGERVRGGLTSNKGRKEKIRRPGPQALLFGCGGGAVLGQTAS